MQIKSFPVGAFCTNCYVVWDEESKRGVVIDPGYDAQRIQMVLAAHQVQCQYILLTHGHIDHITGAQELKEKTGALTVIGVKDAHYMTEEQDREFRAYYVTNYKNTAPDMTVKEGDELEVGALHFRVLETPGHTPGGVCYLCGDYLFCGDTLFQGSCGRTDLEGGNWPEILRSLARLSRLPGNLFVMSGHGPSSTIEREQKYNPFIQEALAAEKQG